MENAPKDEKPDDDSPTVTGELYISADNVDKIAGEDYDRAYQVMPDNALA